MIMDRTLRYRMLKKNYDRLGWIKTSLQQLPTAYLNENDLAERGIRLLELSLHPKDSFAFEPRFCIPFPASKFDAIFEQVEKERELCELEALREEWTLPVPWDNCNYTAAYSVLFWFENALGCGSQPETLLLSTEWVRQYGTSKRHRLGSEFSFRGPWQELAIFHARPQKNQGEIQHNTPKDAKTANQGSTKANKSHIACALVDGSGGDERILRSEMMVALTHMREQMRIKENQDHHRIIPVFVYTFSGRKARIVQVHFDGTSLVVRPTEWIDFKEHDEDNIKLMLRWMMNTPVGDTTYGSSQMDQKVKSFNHPRTPRKCLVSCGGT